MGKPISLRQNEFQGLDSEIEWRLGKYYSAETLAFPTKCANSIDG